MLLSPFSIGQALALVTAGATPGSTCESELLAVLGVEDHGGVPLLADAILSSAEDNSGVSLTTASSVSLAVFAGMFMVLVSLKVRVMRRRE